MGKFIYCCTFDNVIDNFLFTQSRILNLMLFGNDTAITLGVNLEKYRYCF